MSFPKKPSGLVALLAAGFFVHQNCASIGSGQYQPIPVTSRPPSAKIIVDSKVMGTTPIIVRLTKDQDHTVRIEKEGYAPVIILVTRKESPRTSGAGISRLVTALLFLPIGVILGGLAGYVIAPEDSIGHKKPGWIVGGAVLGLLPGVAVLTVSTKREDRVTLSPDSIKVELKKQSERAGVQIIVLGAEQWDRIRWIRIVCSDG